MLQFSVVNHLYLVHQLKQSDSESHHVIHTCPFLLSKFSSFPALLRVLIFHVSILNLLLMMSPRHYSPGDPNGGVFYLRNIFPQNEQLYRLNSSGKM